jgi:diaminopimelate epimerase
MPAASRFLVMNPTDFGGALRTGEFAKYTALGNDYIEIDEEMFGAPAPERVRAICDRHHGVGSDGILFFRQGNGVDVFSVRIFNPDGSEAEKSGNGLRILARFLYEFGYCVGTSLTIQTISGTVTANLHFVGNTVIAIEVAMGRASFDPVDVPMLGPDGEAVDTVIDVDNKPLVVTAVSMGNPHCIHFVKQLDVQELRYLGPLLERHPSFPQRTNVQLAHVRSRHRIDILIWERGAGETLASGSSSCAVAAAAVKKGLVDGDVMVHMPGGELKIQVDPEFGYNVTMQGPATPICRGRTFL